MIKTAKDDWQQVRRIFDDALRHPPEERRQFIRKTCRGDAMLESEITSLVASHDSAEKFLETPAVVQVAENLMPAESLLSPGQRLGHYEIRELIGTGGMAEVYLGRDTRLNRNVAIKLLRENFLPDRLCGKTVVSDSKRECSRKDAKPQRNPHGSRAGNRHGIISRSYQAF